MGNNRTRIGRAGLVAATMGLLVATAGAAPSAMASPDNELIWEEGTVTSVSDGDTLVATLDAGPGARGSQRIRTIGVQAPESVDCGASRARDALKAQLPVGSRVQTRAVTSASHEDDYGSYRIVRSLYAQDEEGNWYDSSRSTVSDGWVMWFPFAANSDEKPEPSHNLEYRVLADDAAGQGRGLWTANLCGGAPYAGADLRIWAKYWGTEEVYVENRSGFAVDLSGWTVRDSGLTYQNLPAGTVVPAGEVRRVFSGDLNLNNLPADNAAFQGDAVYLMDNAGSARTGNLRAWFAYPCNPDNCGDVLSGGITMSAPALDGQPVRKPSAPGSLTATASTTTAATATLTWAAPNDLGGPNGVTYGVTATSTDGGAPASANVSGTSHTFSNLTPGKSYRFSVKAVNSAGSSAEVQTPSAVTTASLPGSPTNLVTEARDASLVVSWRAPSTGSTDADKLNYTATATGGGTTATCPAVGATSCVISGLTNGTSYSVSVVAANSVGVGEPSGSATATPGYIAGGTPLGKPTGVLAAAGDGSAVVSWTKPAQDGGAPITGYQATSPAGPSCTAAAGATSCVVSGLSNGTSYTFTVTANNGTPGPASDASSAVTPFGYVRTSAPTAAPEPADPWFGGQYVDLTNNTGTVARLGGYGLWDAQSSRYNNTENRAAYLFPADTAIPPGGTLRAYFIDGVAPVSTSSTQRIFAGSQLRLDSASDFVELASLSGAQIACRSQNGSCDKAKTTSAPSAPVGITARTTAGSVAVTWGAPISRGGSPITGFTATAYNAPVGGSPVASCAAGGGDRSCSFAASVGGKYYVEVVAANATGTSGPSWRVLAAPRTVPGAPGGVAVSGTPGGLNVSWSPAVENGAAITKYTASAYAAGTGGSSLGSCSTTNGSMTSCTIFGLSGGTYFVDVKATNRAGTGAPSSPRTQGSADAGNAISTYSKGKVTVRWNAPANGAAAGVTGYSAAVYTKSSGGTKVGSCTAGAAATSCTTKKMKKRSKYYIALTVNTSAGAYTVKPRIVTGPPKKPSAPRVTSATPSSRRVAIAWAPPSFTGYTFLKSYSARLYSKSKGGSVKASCSAAAPTPTCTTKAVKKGTYWSAVRVKNSKGWSKWSKRVKVVVP